MRIYLRSKIHKATVTEANLHYVGSITIDEALMEIADIAEFEKVLVVDNTNGNRLETYVIKGEEGKIELQGGTARLGHSGDEIFIFSFIFSDKEIKPKIIFLDRNNRIVKIC